MSDHGHEAPPEPAGEFSVDGSAPAPELRVVPAFLGETAPQNGMYAADGVLAEGAGMLTGQRPPLDAHRPPAPAGEFDVTAGKDPVFDPTGAKVGEVAAEYPVYGTNAEIVGYTRDPAAAARLTSAIAAGDLDEQAAIQASLQGPPAVEAPAAYPASVEAPADDEPLFAPPAGSLADRIGDLEQGMAGLAEEFGRALGQLHARLDAIGAPDASAASDVDATLQKLNHRITALAGEVSRATGVTFTV